MKYIIGSGWWCDGNENKNQKRVLYGDNLIRGDDFNKLWYHCISQYSCPEKIIIVDSCSPVLPATCFGSEVEFISLPINAGHATLHTGKYCGWSRSVLLALQYAIMSDVDYFVYVEQDALLSRKGIIEYCIKKMNSNYMFGSGIGTSHSLQQSFFIIKKDGMENFLIRLQAISKTDNEISPESKFAIAASFFWSIFPSFFWSLIPGFTSRVLKLHRSFNVLPFGYGRSRPIDFDADFFYFQHGNKDEIDFFVKTRQIKDFYN